MTKKYKKNDGVRDQRVRFFQYRAGSNRVLKQSQVAGEFGSGSSVEIFDRVYSVILLNRVIPHMSSLSGYFGYTRCSGLPKMLGNTG